jgi:putative flippase GtrA
LIETPEIHPAVQLYADKEDNLQFTQRPLWKRWPGQFILFGFVGLLNTLLDVLLLNGLLWLFPTTNTTLILLFNSLAYGIGALNSFFLNKYLTFGSRQKASWSEVRRFTLTTLLGIVCNDTLIWLATILFHSFTSSSLGMNIAKLFAIAGTVFVSYFGMRLWVFVKKPQEQDLHSLEENRSRENISGENASNEERNVIEHTPITLSQANRYMYSNVPTLIPIQKLAAPTNNKFKKIQLVNNGLQERVTKKKTAVLQRV